MHGNWLPVHECDGVVVCFVNNFRALYVDCTALFVLWTFRALYLGCVFMFFLFLLRSAGSGGINLKCSSEVHQNLAVSAIDLPRGRLQGFLQGMCEKIALVLLSECFPLDCVLKIRSYCGQKAAGSFITSIASLFASCPFVRVSYWWSLCLFVVNVSLYPLLWCVLAVVDALQGNGSNVVRIMPYMAVQFAAYEQFKKVSASSRL